MQRRRSSAPVDGALVPLQAVQRRVAALCRRAAALHAGTVQGQLRAPDKHVQKYCPGRHQHLHKRSILHKGMLLNNRWQ